LTRQQNSAGYDPQSVYHMIEIHHKTAYHDPAAKFGRV